MADRVTAFAVQIGDTVARRIREHAAANVEQWYVPPAGVEFGLNLTWEQAPRPFIGVSVTSLEDDTAGSSSEQGRGYFMVTVWGWTKDGAEPERASHELASDVRRALTDVHEGRQLGGVLASGALWFAGYEVVVLPDTGDALCVLAFRAMCQMDETNS